jgi:Tfp pilus assembly protein PilF
LTSVQAALAAHAAGDPEAALAALRDLGAAAADDPLALQLWSVLLPTEKRAESLALLERAVRIGPGDGQAHFNLGVTLQAIDHLDRAVLHYQQVLALQPDHLGTLNNLSDLLRRRGRPEEGWALMQRYLEAGGDPKGLEIRLAKLALDTCRFDDAERWFLAAVRHAPHDPKVAWEYAMLTLLRGDWARGWAQYGARIPAYGLATLACFPHAAPLWRGEPIEGKRLLLHREQGLGDMIMFACVFPQLIDNAGELHLAVHPQLVRLFSESFPKARVWSSVTGVGGPSPPQPYLPAIGAVDYQAPIGSLGALCMLDGPPKPGPYIRAPQADAAVWARRLDALAPKTAGERRVGLVIAARKPRFSDDGLTNGLRKSVPAALASRLAGVRGVQWVALHDRESAPALADIPELRFVDTSPWLTDLADTAAVIANLDLVVSVDTAVAHLAAAMGKPVLLMLWRRADWRWGLGETGAFYPTTRSFRQTTAGDWAPVLDAVAAALGSGKE